MKHENCPTTRSCSSKTIYKKKHCHVTVFLNQVNFRNRKWLTSADGSSDFPKCVFTCINRFIHVYRDQPPPFLRFQRSRPYLFEPLPTVFCRMTLHSSGNVFPKVDDVLSVDRLGFRCLSQCHPPLILDSWMLVVVASI